MDEKKQIQELQKLIQILHQKGQSPATSTNYSICNAEGEILISRSGVDKSQFQVTDFLKVDRAGKPLPDYTHVKPSAETLIHCFLYETFADVNCVLHSHAIAPTILSGLFASQEKMVFSGYEVIKGVRGQTTHDTSIELPIFANCQDMTAFCEGLRDRQPELNNFGFLIAKHGLYAWGQDLAEAKRHLEVWTFLLECELEMLKLNLK